nr:hypothetical protein [uncultured Anaerotignum sp.]
MKKQIGLFLGVLLLIGATGCGKEPQKQVLYENKDLGIGFLMPEGYKENPYEVEENVTHAGTVINFLEPKSKALVFSLYSMDKDYWDNEVKESFSIPYRELYRDDKNVLLYLSVSDVQYDVNDPAQKEKYFELLNLKDEVLDSLYFLE